MTELAYNFHPKILIEIQKVPNSSKRHKLQPSSVLRLSQYTHTQYKSILLTCFKLYRCIEKVAVLVVSQYSLFGV